MPLRARSALLTALLALVAPAVAPAATKTWTGAVDGSWSTAGNWSPSGKPATDDNLVFPAAASNKTNVFDYGTALRVGTITFDGGGYVITSSGQSVNLNGLAFTCSNAAGTNTFNVPLVQLQATQQVVVGSGDVLNLGGTIDLGGAAHTLIFSGGGSFNSSGVISGSGSLALGLASLNISTLSGANTYSGATTITAGIVRIQSDTALGSAAGATAVAGSVLEIEGGITVAEDLSIQGVGFLGTGALLNTGGANLWTGDVSLTGATNFGATAGSLEIQGSISSTGLFALDIVTTAGGPEIYFSGANTYTGLTTVLQGRLGLKSGTALGSAAAGTIVQNTGALDVGSVTVNEPLTLNGPGDGPGVGALRTSGAANGIWSGNVTLASATTITADGFLHLTGGVSGSAPLTKEGSQELFLSGTSKAYTGATVINAGTIVLVTDLATTSVTVNDGATLSVNGDQTVAGTLTANTGGLIELFNGTTGMNVGSFTLANGATLKPHLAGPSPDSASRMNVTGSVSLAGQLLLLIELAARPVPSGQTFLIINNDAADSISGTFAGLPNDAAFVANPNTEFQVMYDYQTNDVAVSSLPFLAVVISPTGPVVLCQGASQLLTALPSGGVQPYTGYQWFDGANQINGATSSTYTTSVPGTFSVSVTDSLSVTMTSPQDFVATDPIPPTVGAPTAVTITQTLCG